MKDSHPNLTTPELVGEHLVWNLKRCVDRFHLSLPNENLREPNITNELHHKDKWSEKDSYHSKYTWNILHCWLLTFWKNCPIFCLIFHHIVRYFDFPAFSSNFPLFLLSDGKSVKCPRGGSPSAIIKEQGNMKQFRHILVKMAVNMFSSWYKCTVVKY